MRLFVIWGLLIVAACSHNVGAPPPSASETKTSPPAAATLGPGHGQDQRTAVPSVVGGETISPAIPGGALPGIEKFDRSIEPLTQICGANTYNVRYSGIAQSKFTAALAGRPGPAQTANIDNVDMRVRCHSQGLGGLESRCYGDARVTLTLVNRQTGVRGPTVETAGRSSEAVYFACASGGQAIGQALDDALTRLSDRILSAQ